MKSRASRVLVVFCWLLTFWRPPCALKGSGFIPGPRAARGRALAITLAALRPTEDGGERSKCSKKQLHTAEVAAEQPELQLAAGVQGIQELSDEQRVALRLPSKAKQDELEEAWKEQQFMEDAIQMEAESEWQPWMYFAAMAIMWGLPLAYRWHLTYGW
mmetsp:Transcript_92319/g.214520  ORF Transcript_92319/g.214520 Transcript_92319/m.214520 type:complete len:159 (+) Transcript_92319:77-553(+)